jgi:glutathione S-transferase
MRLYHRDHAGRPIRGAWTMEEAGQPYEVVKMTYEEGKGEDHLARHPLGRVPVLEDDSGRLLFESAAICLQIADTNPQAGLIPAPGTHERGLVYQWAVFGPAEIEPPLIESAIHMETDPERSAKAQARFLKAVAAVSDALGEREFLVGDGFTIADVMVGSALAFTARAGREDLLPENLRAYIGRLAERPAYQRARERTEAPAAA